VKGKERIRIMKLFEWWRKRDGEIITRNSNSKSNHKSVLIGNKQGLFDDIIVGFEDVKALFEMAIKGKVKKRLSIALINSLYKTIYGIWKF